MATPWREDLRPIQDGEQVRAAVTNRPTERLSDRTQYLKDRLDSIDAGEALFRTDVAFNVNVEVGHAVYWDAANDEYASALAAAEVDSTDNTLKLKASSFAVGICYEKTTTTRGTVCTVGTISGFDFTNAIGTPGQTESEAGPYYLSSSEAGKLVKRRPPVGIFILYLTGETAGVAHLNPTPRNIIDDHVHYVFDLTAWPAGVLDPTDPNETYKFTSVDPTLPGWLPADDLTFNGLAPAGAVFGYNIAIDTALSNVFPPVPLDSIYLEADGIAVPQSSYVVDAHGIWWFDACYGKAPWPINAADASSSSSSSSSSSTEECDSGEILEQIGYVRRNPNSKPMRLWFTKMIYKTQESCVTSLQPSVGSAIQILGCSGTPATRGDLFVNFNLNASTQENQDGWHVLKSVLGSTFNRGPIVEGLVAGTNVELVPDPTYGQTVDGLHQGRVTINVADPTGGTREGLVEIVDLNNVLEDSVNETMFLTFPQSKNTSLRGSIAVSTIGIPATPLMRLRFWFLTRAAGTLPEFTVTYRRVPRSSVAAQTLPIVDTALANIDPGTYGSLTSGKYVEVATAEFAIAAGDLVFFTLGRLGVTDGYAGDIGLLRQVWAIRGS